jgi:hypothetical protein
MKEDEIGGACSMQSSTRNKKSVVIVETKVNRELRDSDINWMILLKLILA